MTTRCRSGFESEMFRSIRKSNWGTICCDQRSRSRGDTFHID